MTPSLHPTLLNGRHGDPALIVDHRFERRALLFDLGDLRALPPRVALRVTDVFVSHMHVDHLIGFDQLLRVLVGRDRRVRLYGPPGFADAIGHKLAAYSWNLVDRYAADLVFEVAEAGAAGAAAARFRLKRGFRPEPLSPPALPDGVLLREAGLEVRHAVLDHAGPCLGFAVQEPVHVNVWKARLEAMGLAVGPWLRPLKQAVIEGRPDDTPIVVRDAAGAERQMPLGALLPALRVMPGQKIAYVTDVAPSEENGRRITALARNADVLFIEAVFAAADAALARDRNHLTTAQAGALAARAGARRVEPFHFSPRYRHAEAALLGEVMAAFGGG